MAKAKAPPRDSVQAARHKFEAAFETHAKTESELKACQETYVKLSGKLGAATSALTEARNRYFDAMHAQASAEAE